MMNMENVDADDLSSKDIELSVADKWIRARLQQTISSIESGIAGYRLDLMAGAIYDFVWHDYCDWYLELSKPVLMSEHSSAAAKRGTRQTLINVLEQLLRLAHPIMPYITEEIWQRVAPMAGVSGKTIMTQPNPEFDAALLDQNAIDELEWVKSFIVGVRQIRSGMDIKPGKPLSILLQDGKEQDKQRLDANQHYIENLAKIESTTWLNPGEEAPESATALVGEMKILIPMAGLIDKNAELTRLTKEIGKLQGDIERTRGKLSNESFVSKAPEAVVQKEKDRLAEIETALANLSEQKKKIEAL